ncbi:MAG: metallophosphoesterase [Desulfopila sp.]
MGLFLLIFLVIYSAIHGLVYWGLRPLLKGHAALPTLMIIWMVVMVVAPLLVRLCERQNFEALARALAWVGYSWMGFVFIAFSLCALLVLWDIVVRLLAFVAPPLSGLVAHGPISAILILLLSIAASFYGLYEANDLRVETVRLKTAKLPAGTPPIRIAQISDMHLGLIHRDEALAPVISRLKSLNPDLVVATGDVVDAQINHLEGLSSLWHQLDPPLGKYAVTGNHEFYAGLNQALEYLHQSGFQVLRDQSVDIGPFLQLAGVDDPGRGARGDEEAGLSVASERFTLLLKHRPDILDSSLPSFDLQLSGHTHKGQLFPFTLLTGLAHSRQAGLYRLEGDRYLYTSRGTGTWGPPMRIMAPPEITLFEIGPAD